MATTAREVAAALRVLHPAPVRLSVRADRCAPTGSRFCARLPRAAGIGYRDPAASRWLGAYLVRRLGAPVEVLYQREIRRRDCGRDVEYLITVGAGR